MTELQPHELAELFPPVSADEIAELGRDIALHGQLEPIVLYQGQILDGVNRFKACRLMNREPWTIEFDPERVKRTPEEYVIAANIRRRHLTPGQIAAVAADWAEKVEKEGFLTSVSKTPGPQGGRPRSSALPEISAMLGTIEQRAREAKRIKEADPDLFAALKAGRESLRGALEKIRPPAEVQPPERWLNSNKGTKCDIEIHAARTFARGVASAVYEPVDSPPSPPHSLSGGMIALNHPDSPSDRICPTVHRFTRVVLVGNPREFLRSGKRRPGDGGSLQAAHQELHHLLELSISTFRRSWKRSRIPPVGRRFSTRWPMARRLPGGTSTCSVSTISRKKSYGTAWEFGSQN
jgi:hypothetical protein